MCGITGWIDWRKDLTGYPSILENMTETLHLRGPDASGTWISQHCALGHRRLSVMDPENGAQPMVRKQGDYTYTIVYNGELYNAPELKKELELRGHHFRTTCDTEVLLVAFMEWGKACIDRLNGIFAFAAWNDQEQSLTLVRDRLGVKPLFYSHQDSVLLFGSEPKAILAHPDFKAEVGAEGFAEIFAVGPARTPGHGIYRNMSELKPGQFAIFDRNGLSIRTYWKLESHQHPDDIAATAAQVAAIASRYLRSVNWSLMCPFVRFFQADLILAHLPHSLLLITRKAGKDRLHTFSVDYKDNDKHFKANIFQPNSDAPWIKRMTDHLGTEHHYIEFDTPELVESLKTAVLARDTPGMADVDGSLYLFCREIKKEATVAISGEAADEIFGGYPWFHNEEALKPNTFPWSLKLANRVDLLAPDLRGLD